MKLQLMSDLHLEFEPTFRPENVGSDVLILSGDICPAAYFKKSEASPYYAKGEQFKDFFKHCSDNWSQVMYVPGNHEHYQGRFEETVELLKEVVDPLYNIHILDNHSVWFEGVLFIGGTLWTDLNRNCPLTEHHVGHYMNDFRGLIQLKNQDYRKFLPRDAYKEHKCTLEYFRQALLDQKNVVVCTHHAPSYKSIHVMYSNDTWMNGGYASELTEFIMDHPQIKLWTHGHMHQCHDYMVDGTRVLCNPRGYHDENKLFDPNMIIEVDNEGWYEDYLASLENNS